MKYPNSSIKSNFDDSKIFAILSYLWILFLVPLIFKHDNEFVQFHAKQGMVLFGCWLIGWLFFWLPLVGFFLYLAIIILSAIGIVAAFQGRYWEMPVLGRYARKIKF